MATRNLARKSVEGKVVYPHFYPHDLQGFFTSQVVQDVLQYWLNWVLITNRFPIKNRQFSNPRIIERVTEFLFYGSSPAT